MPPFPVGKLPVEVLAKLLARNQIHDPRVVVGPRIGEDAAVIDFGDTCLVAKTDPITFATDHIGWYAVNINANDIATMGARPKWFLATALLPEGKADEAMALAIFNDITAACAGLGISLCGGHTEITHGLDRPIVVGQMLGEVERDGLVVNADAHPGDAVILANGIAIEGAAIIALERANEVRTRLGADLCRRAQGYLREPGISVVAAAEAVCRAARVSAMHDPTEGGLATGLMELAEAAGCGIEVEAANVMVLPEAQALCGAYGLDPLGTIASGALLIVCPPDHAAAALHALERLSTPAAIIGRMLPRQAGLHIIRDGQRMPLPRFEADEIAKIF